VIAESGVRALFASLPVAIAMNIPSVCTHWVVYETLKRRMHLADEEEFEPRYLLAGFVAGSSGALVSTPFDVVRTTVQLGRAKTVGAAVRLVASEGGVRGFTAGCVPRILQLGPSSAIVMTTYEACKMTLLGRPTTEPLH
jgi:hypothetical protein